MSERLVKKTFSQLKKMYKQAEFALADYASYYVDRRNLVEHMLEFEELTIAKQRILDLERQNELLRAVAAAAKLFGNKAVLFPGYYTISFQYGENLLAATQAAINGGALDNETADSFRQAWSEAQAGDVRPLDELWDGIDGGALEEGE